MDEKYFYLDAQNVSIYTHDSTLLFIDSKVVHYNLAMWDLETQPAYGHVPADGISISCDLASYGGHL